MVLIYLYVQTSIDFWHNSERNAQQFLNSENFRSILFERVMATQLDRFKDNLCQLLFIWGFSSHQRIFHSLRFVTITDEGLQILTYTNWHSLPSNDEGSLMCHTYSDIGQPSILVISKDPWHSYLLLSILQWSCFNNLGLSRPGIKPPAISCMLGEQSTTKPTLWCANFWQKNGVKSLKSEKMWSEKCIWSEYWTKWVLKHW